MLDSGEVRCRGGRSPVQQALNGGAVIAHVGLIEAVAQPGETGGSDVLGRVKVLHQVPAQALSQSLSKPAA